MSVRPLDLQVNINTLMETSREQASRQANLSLEQRTMDGHIIDDAILNQQKVPESDKAQPGQKLEDTERHYGNKTEAETEQQFSEDDKDRRKKHEPGKEEPPAKKPQKPSDHIVDYLV